MSAFLILAGISGCSSNDSDCVKAANRIRSCCGSATTPYDCTSKFALDCSMHHEHCHDPDIDQTQAACVSHSTCDQLRQDGVCNDISPGIQYCGGPTTPCSCQTPPCKSWCAFNAYCVDGQCQSCSTNSVLKFCGTQCLDCTMPSGVEGHLCVNNHCGCMTDVDCDTTSGYFCSKTGVCLMKVGCDCTVGSCVTCFSPKTCTPLDANGEPIASCS